MDPARTRNLRSLHKLFFESLFEITDSCTLWKEIYYELDAGVILPRESLYDEMLPARSKYSHKRDIKVCQEGVEGNFQSAQCPAALCATIMKVGSHSSLTWPGRETDSSQRVNIRFCLHALPP